VSKRESHKQAERARYLGMTIEQYRALRREGF